MLKVNGQVRQFTPSMTVEELLEEMDYPIARVAVERNGKIVPKKTYFQVSMEDGDVIEVVSFVGGG